MLRRVSRPGTALFWLIVLLLVLLIVLALWFFLRGAPAASESRPAAEAPGAPAFRG
jgi:hypothetical protein